jgi:hypothetical protein
MPAYRAFEAGAMTFRISDLRLAAIALAVAASSASAQRGAVDKPVAFTGRAVTFRAEGLAEARRRISSPDPALQPAYRKLLREADSAMVSPIVAVTDKHTLLPPSGDKHDYFSLSPYWWPDPSKPDGLPYIRRDGETNPESKKDLDQPRIATMGANVRDLSLAYYFTGKSAYASRAAQQLRAWFLDPATRMNPHLRFSQLVRGNDKERGSGIIDTRWFIEAIDAAYLLRGSKNWTAADDSALRAWFRNYLGWLLTSDNGKHEQEAKNNHGSWFAAQTAAYSLFVGDTARVRTIAEGTKERIGWQIKPDGQQPIELERTRSEHYSGFNVEALSRVAEAGRAVGVDLWRYRAPEGGSLIAAIDNLGQYVGTEKKWPGQQIDAVSLDLLLIHFRRADYALRTDRYRVALRRAPANEVMKDLSALLYPDPVGH